MQWLKRVLATCVALSVISVLAGSGYQFFATRSDEARLPAPGKQVDIGGRRLHLYCTGTGPITVVLEAGLSANYSTWLMVQRGLQRRTRVCSYDRAGMGFI